MLVPRIATVQDDEFCQGCIVPVRQLNDIAPGIKIPLLLKSTVFIRYRQNSAQTDSDLYQSIIPVQESKTKYKIKPRIDSIINSGPLIPRSIRNCILMYAEANKSYYNYSFL